MRDYAKIVTVFMGGKWHPVHDGSFFIDADGEASWLSGDSDIDSVRRINCAAHKIDAYEERIAR